MFRASDYPSSQLALDDVKSIMSKSYNKINLFAILNKHFHEVIFKCFYITKSQFKMQI